MGRWDQLRGKLPEQPLEDLKFRDKVEQAKLNYAAMTLKDLLFHLNEHDRLKDQLNESLRAENVELEALGQLLKARFINENLRSVQTEFGKTVYLNVEPAIKVQDRDSFEAHIASNEDLDYLWSVNVMTLKALVKEKLEELLAEGLHVDEALARLPAGLKVELDTQVRIRKT